MMHVHPHDALADPLPFVMQDASPRPVGLLSCGCHCVPGPCPIGNQADADATALAANCSSNCNYLQTKCRMDTMRA